MAKLYTIQRVPHSAMANIYHKATSALFYITEIEQCKFDLVTC